MTAVWARVRSELRTRWRSVVALTLVVGVVGGASLAAAAGARRTDTAYARFFTASGGVDAFVNSCPGFGIPDVDLDRVAALPQVERWGLAWSPLGIAYTTGGRPLWFAHRSMDASMIALVGGSSSMRYGRLLAGRYVDPSDPAEAVIGYRGRQDPAVRVGNTIDLRLVRADASHDDLLGDVPPDRAFLPPIPVRIVGLVMTVGELNGDSADVYLTPAFARTHQAEALACQGGAFALKGGSSALPAFTRAVQAIQPGAFLVSQEDEGNTVNRSARLLATILWLFAAIAAALGIVVTAQGLSRQAFFEGQENPKLRALGMSRTQLFAGTLIRASLVGVSGAALAVAVAMLASPLFPTGIARVAEPDPGIRSDPLVLAGGGLAILLGVLIVAVLPAWRAARVRGDAAGLADTAGSDRTSRTAEALARSGAPVSAVTGVRMALEQGHGSTAVPVRSAMAGMTFAVVALTGGAIFASSFSHLVTTPRLYGVTYDVVGANPFAPDFAKDVTPAILADRRISAASFGNVTQTLPLRHGSLGRSTNVWGFDAIRGSLHPPVLEGRWPRLASEIALGGTTMHQLGTHVGADIAVAGTGPATVRVVGRAVFQDNGFGSGLGEGAGMTLAGLRRFVPDAAANVFVMQVRHSSDAAGVVTTLRPVFQPFGAQLVAGAGDLGTSLENLKRVRRLPTLLAGLLALAGLAGLVHALVTSVRRRQRDLAVLKTLGFSKGQVRATVAWQATTLATVAVAIGVPVGIVLGRWGWLLFADRLGVVPETSFGISMIALLVPATLVLANLIAAAPAGMAARTKPALVLRSE